MLKQLVHQNANCVQKAAGQIERVLQSVIFVWQDDSNWSGGHLKPVQNARLAALPMQQVRHNVLLVQLGPGEICEDLQLVKLVILVLTSQLPEVLRAVLCVPLGSLPTLQVNHNALPVLQASTPMRVLPQRVLLVFQDISLRLVLCNAQRVQLVLLPPQLVYPSAPSVVRALMPVKMLPRHVQNAWQGSSQKLEQCTVQNVLKALSLSLADRPNVPLVLLVVMPTAGVPRSAQVAHLGISLMLVQ